MLSIQIYLKQKTLTEHIDILKKKKKRSLFGAKNENVCRLNFTYFENWPLLKVYWQCQNTNYADVHSNGNFASNIYSTIEMCNVECHDILSNLIAFADE